MTRACRPVALRRVLTAVFTCSLSSLAAAAAPGSPSCERHIAEAARRYEIPLAVFYAVGLQETGGRDGLRPFMMNVDGRSVANDSLVGAMAALRSAQAAGARHIDIGCMQINLRYHGEHFASPAEMFDPAHNVDYAARFLRQLRGRESSWTMAVARYNAGPDNNPAQKRYVCGVIGKMVASGFGAWTANAKAFCAPTAAAREAAASPSPTPAATPAP